MQTSNARRHFRTRTLDLASVRRLQLALVLDRFRAACFPIGWGQPSCLYFDLKASRGIAQLGCSGRLNRSRRLKISQAISWSETATS
jgi:hypothetical protein